MSRIALFELSCVIITDIIIYIGRFGIGVGNTALTQVQCGEDDNHILRCFAMGVTGFCDHTQDVGIYCCKYSIFIFYYTYSYSIIYVQQ